MYSWLQNLVQRGFAHLRLAEGRHQSRGQFRIEKHFPALAGGCWEPLDHWVCTTSGTATSGRQSWCSQTLLETPVTGSGTECLTMQGPSGTTAELWVILTTTSVHLGAQLLQLHRKKSYGHITFNYTEKRLYHLQLHRKKVICAHHLQLHRKKVICAYHLQLYRKIVICAYHLQLHKKRFHVHNTFHYTEKGYMCITLSILLTKGYMCISASITQKKIICG